MLNTGKKCFKSFQGYTDYKNKQRCTLPCVFGECRFVNDDQIDIGGNTSQETPVYSARGPTGLKLKQVCDCKSAAGTVFEYDKHCALVLPPDKCPCQNGICKPIPRKAFWKIYFSYKIAKISRFKFKSLFSLSPPLTIWMCNMQNRKIWSSSNISIWQYDSNAIAPMARDTTFFLRYFMKILVFNNSIRFRKLLQR